MKIRNDNEKKKILTQDGEEKQKLESGLSNESIGFPVVRGMMQRSVTITTNNKKRQTQDRECKSEGRKLGQENLFESTLVRGTMRRSVTILIISKKLQT